MHYLKPCCQYLYIIKIKSEKSKKSTNKKKKKKLD